MQLIYFDNNSTTLLDPAVAEAMLACEADYPANPSSQHQAGRRARRALEDAREAIAAMLGLRLDCPHPDRLVFTSGGTESNNLALLGLAGAGRGKVIVSSVEHPSVFGPAAELARRGCQVLEVRVDRDGRIDLDHLTDLLTERPRLVSIQLANQETGVLQPVVEAAAICARRGVPLHTDAVQAVAKTPVRFDQLGAAAMSAAAHKFHGPRGIGILALAGGIDVAPLMFGGFQQGGLRPGTEPLSLIVGMRVALERWQRQQDQRQRAMTALRDELERLLAAGFEGLVIQSAQVPRLPQTSSISFPGLDRQALLIALDLAGVACSTGSACASGSSEPSAVLRAMGCSEELLAGALRFSLGMPTTRAEVQEGCRRILKVANELRSQRAARKFSRETRSYLPNSL